LQAGRGTTARRFARGIRTILSPEIVSGGLDYFEYQVRVAREVVIPWLSQRMQLEGARVADFGCHAGGMLEGLRGTGVAEVLGIESNESVVRDGPFVPDERFRIEIADLTRLDDRGRFDLVLLHDVLEHVVDCGAVLDAARRSLAPGGRVFVSFPPYWSSFGGHQFLASGRARAIPFVHLAPERLFLRAVRPADNAYMRGDDSFEDIVSVRRTRLSLAKAERSFDGSGLGPVAKELFLLRPEHTVRYGLPTVRAGALGRVAGAREVLVSGAFYLLAARD
jgi:SAM-dependent methyltransferase